MFYLKAALTANALAIVALVAFMFLGYAPENAEGSAADAVISLENAQVDQDLIRALIAEERFVQARMHIENGLKSSSAQQKDELILLMGLSYLKESDEKPISAVLPYDKLAFSYFKQLPMDHPRFADDRRVILQTVAKRLRSVSNEQAQFYVALLQSWDAKDEVHYYAQQLDYTPNIPSQELILAWLGVAFERQHAEMFPMEQIDRHQKIQKLMEMRRYDLALAQWRLLEREQLKPQDKIHYITLLMHQGQKDLALWQALHWIAQKPALPQETVITIAQQLQMPFKTLKTLLNWNEIPTAEQRSRAVNTALFSYWLEQGDYKNVEKILFTDQADLESTPEGLFLLAKYHVALSHTQHAFAYARQALKRQPANLEVRKFLESHEMDRIDLSDRIQQLQQTFVFDPKNVQLQLELAQLWIDSALAQDDLALYLQQASALINRLAKTHSQCPQVYLLQGEVAWLLGEQQEAIIVLNQALKLDITDIEAYKYLALIYMEMAQPQQALASLQAAIRIAPFDAELWHELAHVQQKMGDSLEALDSLAFVTNLRPNDPEGYIDSAVIQMELHNSDAALAILEKVLKVFPKNARALKLAWTLRSGTFSF